MPMARATAIPEFLRAFTVGWLVRMSGPLSVLFALAGVWATTEITRTICAITAVVCLVACAYGIWKIEYDKRLSAEGGVAAVLEPQPDWPIHELFSHLEPELFDRPQDDLTQKAGDKIRDALSLGQLRMWGRPVKTKMGDWVGERAALRLIASDYWQKAYFTYFFFDETAPKDAVHCFADRTTGVPAYTDLQINRAEVLKLWPGEPNDIAESYPNVRVADAPQVIGLFDGGERSKIISLLAAEKLAAWARVMADLGHDHIRLSGKIWNTHAFRVEPKSADAGSINQTFLRPRGTQNSTYYDLCLNYAQLKRIWPELQVRRSKCDVL